MSHPDTIYITDLDGTLLNSEGRVGATTAKIISDLCRQGAKITIATARTIATVSPLLADIDFGDNPPKWVLVTGAMTYDPKTGRADFTPLTTDRCLRLDEAFARYGLNPFVYTAKNGERIHVDVYHIPAMTDIEHKFYEERSELILKTFHFDNSPEKFWLGSPVADEFAAPLLYLGMGSPDDVFPLADHLRQAGVFYVSAYVDTYDSAVAYIEVFTKGVSKANAIIREFADYRKVVFGDNLNDVEMLRAADVAVAVKNAVDEVKSVADIVIGTNDSDAVARFIRDEKPIRND